jgi:hypothetical protein
MIVGDADLVRCTIWVNQSFKNQIGDRTGEAFGSRFTGWTAGSNRFDVGFLVVK